MNAVMKSVVFAALLLGSLSANASGRKYKAIEEKATPPPVVVTPPRDNLTQLPALEAAIQLCDIMGYNTSAESKCVTPAYEKFVKKNDVETQIAVCKQFGRITDRINSCLLRVADALPVATENRIQSQCVGAESVSDCLAVGIGGAYMDQIFKPIAANLPEPVRQVLPIRGDVRSPSSIRSLQSVK